jgi:hypothetical protein
LYAKIAKILDKGNGGAAALDETDLSSVVPVERVMPVDSGTTWGRASVWAGSAVSGA